MTIKREKRVLPLPVYGPHGEIIGWGVEDEVLVLESDEPVVVETGDTITISFSLIEAGE